MACIFLGLCHISVVRCGDGKICKLTQLFIVSILCPGVDLDASQLITQLFLVVILFITVFG
jgi:hypothetical protein